MRTKDCRLLATWLAAKRLGPGCTEGEMASRSTKRTEVKLQREPLSEEEKAREIQVQREFDEAKNLKGKELSRTQVRAT